MDRLIMSTILCHLDCFCMISLVSHGFAQSRPYFIRLLMPLEPATCWVDNVKFVDLCYLNISKAFHFASQKLLLSKLDIVGFSGNMIHCINAVDFFEGVLMFAHASFIIFLRNLPMAYLAIT